jgi:hypothetical protein
MLLGAIAPPAGDSSPIHRQDESVNVGVASRGVCHGRAAVTNRCGATSSARRCALRRARSSRGVRTRRNPFSPPGSPRAVINLMMIPTTPITRLSAPRCRTRPTRSSTPSANSTWVANDNLALRDPPDRSRRQYVAGCHAASVQPAKPEFVGELHRAHVLVSVQMPVDLRVRIPYLGTPD